MPADVADNLDLQAVYVLVLVDQDVVEPALELRPDRVVRSERAPIKQQVVQIDDAEHFLARRVRLVQTGNRLGVLLAPRKELWDEVAESTLAVDRPRVDLKQRAHLGTAAPSLGVTVLLAQQGEQVGGVTGGDRD